MYFLDIRLVFFFSLLGRKEGRKKEEEEETSPNRSVGTSPPARQRGKQGLICRVCT
jgi:hypothetical protein